MSFFSIFPGFRFYVTRDFYQITFNKPPISVRTPMMIPFDRMTRPSIRAEIIRSFLRFELYGAFRNDDVDESETTQN